jgi:hypothetical protein
VLTEKIGGKVLDTQEITVCEDGKTLTTTVHVPERSTPDVLVFRGSELVLQFILTQEEMGESRKCEQGKPLIPLA